MKRIFLGAAIALALSAAVDAQTITPAANPGGATTQLQYNNAGTFGGISGATTNGTFVTLVTPVLGAATGTSLALNSNASTLSLGSSSDVILLRDGAANTLALRNGANAQTFNVYNTFTDASNYEDGVFRWASNILRIGTDALGTGTARSISILVGGATVATITNGSGGTLALGNGVQSTGIITLGNSTAGLSINGATSVVRSITSGSARTQMDGAGFHAASNLSVDFNSGTDIGSGSPDTGISRDAAGVVDAGTGTAGSSAGAFKASAYLPGGAAPALTGTCTTGTQLGGQTAGSFLATCTAQTVIVTFARSAPNGWVCIFYDVTTNTDTIKQTGAASATTCTGTGTTVASDRILFTASPY